MFAPRFDPNSVYDDKPRAPMKLLPRKRKLQTAQIKDSSSDESDNDKVDDNGNKKGEKEKPRRGSECESESDSGSEYDSESQSEKDEVSSELYAVLASEYTENHPNSSRKESQGSPKPKLPLNSALKREISLENDDDMDIDHPKEKKLESSQMSKNAGILRRFVKSTQNQDVSSPESDTEMADAKDLEPIPQPELPKDDNLVGHQRHQKNLDWLAAPQYASLDVRRPFSEFGLSSKVIQNLGAEGYSDAFSVQVAVLKEVMGDLRKNQIAPDFQGDLLVNASTGSGKTLAYLIPIVEALHTRTVPRIRAIILVPTKPLIGQVAATIRGISNGTGLSIVTLTNDKSIREEGSKISRNVPDIVVSTPGRLVEHILGGSVLMESLRFLVIDEADRLLSQSFHNWCEVVVSAMEKWERPEENTANVWRLQPQKMVFSATLTTDAGKLAFLKFRKPRLIVVGLQEQFVSELFSVPRTLREHQLQFSSAKSAIKPLILAKFLLHTNKVKSVLVFANSNDATLRLTRVLNDLFVELTPGSALGSIPAVAYVNSTNNVSSVRKRILDDFDKGRVGVLVATDLIARGLDLLSITDVVNYDIPNSSREYVHRVGRTARANNNGEAFTLCFGRGEERWFKGIMADVSRAHPIVAVEEEPVLEAEKSAYSRVMAKFQASMNWDK